MPDGFTLDTTDDCLTRGGGRTEQGRPNLKGTMAARFAARPHFKRIAQAISYDRIGFAKQFGFEVGPEVGRGAGSLVGIAVEGGARGGGGTVVVDDLLAGVIDVLVAGRLKDGGWTVTAVPRDSGASVALAVKIIASHLFEVHCGRADVWWPGAGARRAARGGVGRCGPRLGSAGW
jgi:hypothetical protein